MSLGYLFSFVVALVILIYSIIRYDVDSKNQCMV